MPTLREECLENLAEDIDNYVFNKNQTIDDNYNKFLDGLDHYEFNFWTINYTMDEMNADDLQFLNSMDIPIRTYDLLLKHYYKQVCIETKVWICEIIQEKLNKV